MMQMTLKLTSTCTGTQHNKSVATAMIVPIRVIIIMATTALLTLSLSLSLPQQQQQQQPTPSSPSFLFFIQAFPLAITKRQHSSRHEGRSSIDGRTRWFGSTTTRNSHFLSFSQSSLQARVDDNVNNVRQNKITNATSSISSSLSSSSSSCGTMSTPVSSSSSSPSCTTTSTDEFFFEEALIELESIQAQASPGLLFPCPEKSVLVIEDIEDNNQLLLQNVDYYGDSIDDNEQYGKGLMGLLSSPPRANYEEISKAMTKDQKEGDTVGVVVVVVDDDDDNDDEKRMQQEQEQKIVRSRWLLIVAAALYGTNFSVVKILGDDMSIPVGISTSLRFGLAAFATLPWLLDGVVTLPTFTSKPTTGTGTEEQTTMPTTMNSNYNDSDNSVSGKNTIDSRLMATLWGLEVGMWNSFGYVAQAVGLETTLASKSAFLCSMAVVIVPLLDWIAGKKLLSRQWIGAMMALVGVGFLELGGGGSGSSGGGGEIVAATTTATGVLSSLTSDITKGDILSMVQPFTFGLGFWRMEQAMKQYPKEAPRMTAAQLTAVFVSSVVYGLWSLDVFDGGVTGIVSSLADIGSSYPWHEWFTDPSVIFALFWTGCVTTALTIYMETLALEYLSAAETTLIFSTEPLWGTAFAVALMGEQLGMNAAVGGSLILAACIYSNLGINGVRDMSKKTVDRILSITAATTVGRERGTVIDDKNRKETSTR